MAEKRILIAEDDYIIAMDLAQILKSWKYKVKIISSGEEAVLKAYALKPDLILMDIALKGMNGLEAAQKIQTLSIPIIYITGKDISDQINQQKHAYIKKPFDIDILQSQIKIALKEI